jgi:hypothetical protein
MAVSASEMLIRNPEVDFDTERTPDDLKRQYTHLKVIRTDQPDQSGETEQLWGVADDGTQARLDWQVLYDSLKEDTGYDDIPRQWTHAELSLDAYGRSLRDGNYWRQQFVLSERRNRDNEQEVEDLREQLEGQKSLNRTLQNDVTQQRTEIEQLKAAVARLENRPANANNDPRRRKRALLVGGLAVLGAGVACYLLGRHYGHGPELAQNFKDIIAQHDAAMADQHNVLFKEVNDLQAAVDRDSTVIHDLRDQLHADTRLLHHVNDHLHDLKDAATDQVSGTGGGNTNTAAPAGKTGERFFVEKSNGITNEIMQYAHTKGKNISTNTSFEFYKQLKRNFGEKIITHHYMHGDEVRISQSGWAHWYPKAGEMLNRLINKA